MCCLPKPYAPTPAFRRRSNTPWELLVITASHNPGSYLGLKQGAFWIGSPEITSRLKRLPAVGPEVAKPGSLKMFNLGLVTAKLGPKLI